MLSDEEAQVAAYAYAASLEDGGVTVRPELLGAADQREGLAPVPGPDQCRARTDGGADQHA